MLGLRPLSHDRPLSRDLVLPDILDLPDPVRSLALGLVAVRPLPAWLPSLALSIGRNHRFNWVTKLIIEG